MTVLSSHGHDLQLTVATTNQELETVRKKDKRQKKTASLSNNDAYIELAPIYHNTITTPALREDELHEEISEGPLLSMCRYVTCSWPGAVRPDAGPVIRASPARKAGRKREVRRSRWLSLQTPASHAERPALPGRAHELSPDMPPAVFCMPL